MTQNTILKLILYVAALVLLIVFPLQTIAVEHSGQVTLVFRGQTYQTPVRSETFSQLLTRLELETVESDTLSHPLETQLCDGMTLRVDSVLTRVEDYTVAIVHESQTCYDSTLPEGQWEVLIPGSDGELSCQAEVTYINGKEAQRNVLSQVQTIAPVTEVIAWGTGPVPETKPVDPNGLPIIEDGYIRLPTGEVLTYTGTATVRASAYTHTDAGCDLITSTGSRVHVGTVAVDPRYIPYGTRMFIMATSGSYVYGVSEAEDCGGAIKGDRVDLYLPTYDECMQFGRRVCTVYYLG